MKIKVQSNPISNLLRRDIPFTFFSDLSYGSFGELRDHINERTEENFSSKIEEIKSMFTVLDESPVDVGLQSLNVKLNQIQAYKDRLSDVMLEVYQAQNDWEILLFYVNKFYSYNFEKLLAEPFITELKNQGLRTAAVHQRIPDIIDCKDYCSLQIQKTKVFLKQADIVFLNLKSTNDNISRQITVLQIQIDVGEIRRKYRDD